MAVNIVPSTFPKTLNILLRLNTCETSRVLKFFSFKDDLSFHLFLAEEHWSKVGSFLQDIDYLFCAVWRWLTT